MKKPTHGGKRKGAGRKPAEHPLHVKKFRASEGEWQELLSYLMGDATSDFDIVIRAVRIRTALIKKIRDDETKRINKETS